MGLSEYNKKRNFKKTREPQGGQSSRKNPLFVVQEHWASHHHFDFRLEAFGTLKSWAVPKGPSVTVGDKRLAVEVEDHPIDYAKFKGQIPEGEYGAGKVEIWDKGVWIPPKDLKSQLSRGHLEFELSGSKLKGKWLLQRLKTKSGRKSQWLLIKRHDDRPSLQQKDHSTKKSKDNWPEIISPQLALLVDEVPKGQNYLHEIKFDGYRTLAQIKNKSIHLFTRNGKDWTKKYHSLQQELKKLKADSIILDGEVVALDKAGHSSFTELQTALKENKLSKLFYYVFDLLYLNDEDLRSQPLHLRKQLLKELIDSADLEKIIYSEHVVGDGKELFAAAKKKGLEGIVSKEKNSLYVSGRTPAWQKIKTSLRQELVIGGFTDPQGQRQGFGALLMGVYEDGKFKYVGRVGTGFNDRNIPVILERLKKITVKESPFSVHSPKNAKTIHWVKPKLVAEIEFKAWTKDEMLRQASFQGLRADKSSAEVKVEKPLSVKKPEPLTKGGFKITHPDRLIYPEAEIKKIDVANYYKTVSPWLLPHLAGRPLSLLRCPNQSGENCFFQKHIESSSLPDVHERKIRDQKVIYVDSEKGLLQLIQWGVLELHTWQCHIEKPLSPDQIVFDLDPDANVSWKQVCEAALNLKDLLEKLDLQSFLKVTGGKGLHLHVPIAPIYSWEKIKNFAKTVCLQMESENPELYTTNILKKVRKDKIFLDYLRNGFGATAITPFSLRARVQPTAAVPIAWSDLKKIKKAAPFQLASTLENLVHQKNNPWKNYLKMKQKIKILD